MSSQNVHKRREQRLAAAEGYLDLQMPDHALHELDAIEDPDCCPPTLHRLRGEAQQQKHDFHSALESYGRALAENPRDLQVLLGMAWCYKRTGELSKAIVAMEQAYRASPNEPIVLYNTACYYALAGNKVQALSWLGRALRMQKGLRELIPEESDFDVLREDPDFKFIVGKRGHRG